MSPQAAARTDPCKGEPGDHLNSFLTFSAWLSFSAVVHGFLVFLFVFNPNILLICDSAVKCS